VGLDRFRLCVDVRYRTRARQAAADHVMVVGVASADDHGGAWGYGLKVEGSSARHRAMSGIGGNPELLFSGRLGLFLTQMRHWHLQISKASREILMTEQN
jgi:hypothetical protein